MFRAGAKPKFGLWTGFPQDLYVSPGIALFSTRTRTLIRHGHQLLFSAFCDRDADFAGGVDGPVACSRVYNPCWQGRCAVCREVCETSSIFAFHTSQPAHF